MKAETRAEAKSQSLLLLVSFARALAHKIRTPLSVISNELSFLSSRFPDECAPSIARVAEISAILKSANSVDCADIHAATVKLHELLSVHFNYSGPANEDIAGDAALLSLAFGAVKKLFDTYGDSSKVRADLKSHDQSVICRIYGKWAEKTAPTETASLTELLSKHLGVDSVTTPFIDAIVAAHGGKIAAAVSTAEAGSTFTVSFIFPRATAK